MDKFIEPPKNGIYEVPILLIAYNRSQYIQEQIKHLKSVRPTKIFIACDGPKNAIDEEKVKKVRELYLQLIDWDCDIQTRFSDENQGCFKGVKNALEWFFSSNKEGVIIEDDIIPSKDFFHFMEVMLNAFRNDKKIFSISGCNLGYNADSSIFASNIMNMWGWATWADRFFEVDFSIASWQNKTNKHFFLYKKLRMHLFDYDKKWIEYWISIFDKAVKNDNFSTWDYQLIYNQLESSKLTVFSGTNLVKNLGFDEDATHTQTADHLVIGLKTFPLKWPLQIPKRLTVNPVFYENYIKERWAYYKRPNWKYYLGELLKKLGIN